MSYQTNDSINFGNLPWGVEECDICPEDETTDETESVDPEDEPLGFDYKPE